jgi:UDP-N-acetylmuramoylalanine--D-glutamate ligase
MNFKNKKILVVGFGKSGQAAARFFLQEGAKVAVTDMAAPSPLPSFGPLESCWGKHPAAFFEKRDLIVVSPGIPLDLPGIRSASRRRIPIIGEFGLAAEWIARKWKTPMIAVTGTNGKSTTVSLITKMLEKAGKRVALAGNIGKPLLEVVMEGKKPDWIVAEVSSYKLETVKKFHPKISVLLNITEDHLDRYDSFKDYARAKSRIFKEQTARDFLIYNEEDKIVRAAVKRSKAKKIGFSITKNLKGKKIVYGKESYSLDRVTLVGLHNIENMAASIMAARVAGVPEKEVQEALETFTGLPHRTVFVRSHLGVRYYDDSKGTNVDAAVKSLSGFPDGKVILLAGGRDKGGSYASLKKMAAKKAKLALLFGESKEKIAKALKGTTETVLLDRLEEAVLLASMKAREGDIVLLSPACSSFDQFKDYKERGETFQKMVLRL